MWNYAPSSPRPTGKSSMLSPRMLAKSSVTGIEPGGVLATKFDCEAELTSFSGVIWRLTVNSFSRFVRGLVRVVLLPSWHSSARYHAPLTLGSACMKPLMLAVSKESFVQTHQPWLTSMCEIALALILRAEFLELFLNIFDNAVGHLFHSEVRYQADREFALYIVLSASTIP